MLCSVRANPVRELCNNLSTTYVYCIKQKSAGTQVTWFTSKRNFVVCASKVCSILSGGNHQVQQNWLVAPDHRCLRLSQFLVQCRKSSARVVQPSSNSAYLNRVLDEAEKVVGCKRQYFDTSSIIDNEIPLLALKSLSKIAAANHPIVEFSRKLSQNDHNNVKSRGLILLLLSKMAGVKVTPHHIVDPSVDSGILPQQRNVAEAVEIITSALLVHYSILNIRDAGNAGPCNFSLDDDPENVADEELDETTKMHAGNKISVLGGDYLLATSIKLLAETKSSEVVRLLARSITDSMEGQFTVYRDRRGHPIPTPGMNIDDWEIKSYTFLGSIMAHSCQAQVSLAGHDRYVQQNAFEFGKNVAHAWQAHDDLQVFLDPSNRPSGSPFDLTSAPVILHLEDDPMLFEHIRSVAESVDGILDFDEIYEAVLKGDGVAKTRALLEFYVQRALDVIQAFPLSPAKKALSNMVLALRK